MFYDIIICEEEEEGDCLTNESIISIRQNVKDFIGHKVKIRTNRSRKKVSIKEGIGSLTVA